MSRTSRAEWAKRVERWKDSGLSAKQYAAEIGVKATTLSYWSWKLNAGGERRREKPSGDSRRREGSAVNEMAAGFVELATPSSSTTPPALELVLCRGVRVSVSAGFDEGTLTRLVRAVQAAQ